MALEDATNPMQGVSGPGPYAKRTDLSYKSQSYGDAAAYNAEKSAAPLATTSGVKLSQAPRVGGGAPTGIGLYDPSQRPEEDTMYGNKIGPGADASALMMSKPADDSEFRMRIESVKPVLAYIADLPNTSPETRAAIKELWNMQ
jgi:hypothetical protein